MATATAEKKQVESTAVTKRRTNIQLGERGLQLDNLDAAIRFAEGLIHGGMVPKGVTSPGAVVGLIEAGKELGLAPMYALSNLTFTNGRLGIMGDAAKALIRRSGALEPGTDFGEVYSGDEFTADWKCSVTAHRVGQPKPFESSFSIGDALTAKLIRLDNRKVMSRARDGWGDSGPWSTYTKRMLMYRALGFLVRDRFSDIIGGATLAEELRDFQSETVREAAAPVEPDPLLAEAPAAEAIEAEVVTDTPPAPPPPLDPGDAVQNTLAVPAEEAAAIKAIEKLEGQLVTAESVATLDRIWNEAKAVVDSLGVRQRKQLERLYQQNRAGLTPAK